MGFLNTGLLSSDRDEPSKVKGISNNSRLHNVSLHTWAKGPGNTVLEIEIIFAFQYQVAH